MVVYAIVLLAALVFLFVAHLNLLSRLKRLRDEVVRANQALAASQQTLEELKQREGLKDEFISTVSHELRTPLTSIRGALGLLSSGVLGKLEDRPANLLRIASSNTDRLVRLVNDILDLQRMESREAPLVLRPCNACELLRQAVETMDPMAALSGVALVLQPGPHTEELDILINPDRMLQVLCNLLSNAVKFSPRHTPVYLRTGLENETVVICVEDSGRGVPAEKLESIFDRFGQVEASDSRQHAGTGLGLAICRSIMTQHGGTIHAQRNDAVAPGRPGTTLVIRLPLAARNPSSLAALHAVLA